jgi:hypothetical protein
MTLCVVLVACGDGSHAVMDARIDSAPDAFRACQAPATDANAAMYTLFINTEGASLVTGSCDDARTNCTRIITADQVVPPFLNGDATRQENIDQIVAAVRTVLAPFSVDVVTTRPASGDYYMSVIGGDSMTITGNAGVLSLAPATCNSQDRDSIDLVFDFGFASNQRYANSILSDFGAMLGLPATTKVKDCMCRENGCADPTNAPCTFGQGVPVGTANPCGVATSDEQTTLEERVGCR